MDTITRPWGHFQVLDEGPGFLVKRIVVKPKQRLSLQAHMMRDERWCGVTGRGKVTIGVNMYELDKGATNFVPAGKKHRIENIGESDLILIEIQTGQMLNEDDVARYEDDYGRT